MGKTRNTIGIVTAGGDCPGLNAAIRGVAKTCLARGMAVVGFQDGFRGLVENRGLPLTDRMVSGILTQGGTLLGSSRDKPHKMRMGGRKMDMTEVAVDNARKHQIDCLVCLGGNGTQKNAWRLAEKGLDVLTLPKTIDNDVGMTDICFGFDSAMAIATQAIDRLHTTATSHHRIIVCEIMGHDAGWLALGAGIAGGADVILIPEIPYDPEVIAESLMRRRRAGKRFSIIAVAEGIRSIRDGKDKESVPPPKADMPRAPRARRGDAHLVREPMASRIAREIQGITGTEARVTSLGHVQRGGEPTPFDRLLCTRMGSRAGDLLRDGHFNCMVALQGTDCVPVPLKKVAGIKKTVPPDHDWIQAARRVGTCLGDPV